jgi:ubiquinone/menaquinone biosynthesis C-methylase UbiE
MDKVARREGSQKTQREKEEIMITQKKPQIGMGMEGRIAKWYEKTTRKDMAEFRNLAERLARETPAHSRVLEVAPGPGFLAIELAKLHDYQIAGLDISNTFVEIARENARKESVTVDFQHGNASAMPFGDETFDLIVCRAAFKNFSQPLEALNEMHRVLKPGGRALIIDLRKDVPMSEINNYAQRPDIGWFDGLMIKLTFRYMLIPRAYRVDQFKTLTATSKFGGSEIKVSGIGMEIALKK